jgi:hypothetical protein
MPIIFVGIGVAFYVFLELTEMLVVENPGPSEFVVGLLLPLPWSVPRDN